MTTDNNVHERFTAMLERRVVARRNKSLRVKCMRRVTNIYASTRINARRAGGVKTH